MKNLLIGLVVGIAVWLASSALMTAAQDIEEEASEEVTQEDYACARHLYDKVPSVIDDYETFLNDFFKVDAPSSEQIENAMEYYRYIEDRINDYYDEGLGFDIRRVEFTKQADEYAFCTYVRNQYLDFAKALLHEQALQSTSSKQAFGVVDGLKAMNENMEDFTREFLSTFPTMFNKMDNALPCYASQCITR